MATELLSTNKMRQREQSTWAWTEHATGGKNKTQEGAVNDGQNALFFINDACPSTAEATTKTRQDMANQTQPCCCEILENALVTIDILRSKLVGVI